jgi:sporulation protein YlmC with PRC-barrel domain
VDQPVAEMSSETTNETIMKRTTSLAACAAAILCSCTQPEDASGVHRSQFRKAESFTEFIGLEMRNLQDERLGVVKHITVDLENARVVEVIVTPDAAIAGRNAPALAVPPRAVSLDSLSHVLRLDASKAKFAAAPRYSAAHMDTDTQRSRVAQVNRHFGMEPWFFTDGQKVMKNAKILRLGYVQRTDQVLRLPIQNHEGEYVGRVGTLRMDLPKGQIVHVVVVTDKAASSRSVIQARALKFNGAKDGLIVDSTMAELAGEPHFRWVNGSKTSYQEEAYVNREVKADKGLHSQQNEQSGKVRNAIPMEEGDSYRDNEKTRQIKAAIQADSALSANAKNIEVVTLNAQTTLRGHVNTPADKERVGAIAEKAGRAENVSNLVEVRPP